MKMVQCKTPTNNLDVVFLKENWTLKSYANYTRRSIQGSDISSENVIYVCYYKTKSLWSKHVLVSPTTPCKHVHFEVIYFCFIIGKIYNILRYVIPRILCHTCNLHIKETEISQKRSKGTKNWKIIYSVILSVLSNKTNMILGFSSP